MSPEERRLLTDLFDRVRSAAGTPRDHEAEDLIARKLEEQPYAAYFLAQAVIVQDQALQATAGRIRELEDHVQQLETRGRDTRDSNESGGFLSSLGSLFGGGQSTQTTQRRDDYRNRDDYARRDAYAERDGRLYDDYARSSREPEPAAPSPWGRAGATGPWAQQATAAPGSSFLHGALTTAAGVAGGVLVADVVRDMFSPNLGGTATNPLANTTSASTTPVQETVNNYFVNDDKSNDKSDDGDRGSGSSASGRDDDNRGWGGGDDNNNNNSNDDDYVADYDDGGSDDDSYA